MTTYFISGHRIISKQEWEDNYVPLLKQAVSEGASFIVGDCDGVDTIAQQWLFDNNITDVKVYHMLVAPRNNVGFFETIGGFTSDEERDTAMTNASDKDIVWIRKGKSKSGTAQNVLRRFKKIMPTAGI